MATIERVEPAYQPWSPSAAGFGADEAGEEYVGRHRRSGRRVRHRRDVLRVLYVALFYTGRHRSPRR